MSQLDLRRFAYQRRKVPLLPVRKNPPCEREESSLAERTDRAASTPNKASQDLLTSTVPETPDSCWPKAAAPASSDTRNVQLARRSQRRRHRALSSSDDDGESVDRGGRCPPGNLFDGLGTSKRRKRGPNDACHVVDKENATEDEFSLYAHVAATRTGKRVLVNQKDRSGGRDVEGDIVAGDRTGGDVTDRLMEMFPRHSPGYLRAVARRHRNVSEAVAVIVADSNESEEQG